MASVDTLMSPRIDAKIRQRLFANSVLKDKYPDFKDILRERFKNKIKQNRRTLFQKMRSFHDNSSNVESMLCDYLHEEIDEISHPLKTTNDCSKLTTDRDDYNFDMEHELEAMKEIETELLEEQLNWVMEEYNKEEENLNEIESKALLCPICQRGFLFKNDNKNIIVCTRCSVQLCSTVSLEELHSIIADAVNEHSSRCNSNSQFTIINEPNSSGLFMICYSCSLLNALC